MNAPARKKLRPAASPPAAGFVNASRRRPRYLFARLTFSQPFVLSRLSTVAASFLPAPQSTVSLLPLRALTVSLPAPPL
jgi:hypothetical protein